MRDTAPALQSITKHNHMARAGEDCFDSEQRIRGWEGGAFQIWTEAQRAGRPILAFMPALPPQPPLSRSRVLSERVTRLEN